MKTTNSTYNQAAENYTLLEIRIKRTFAVETLSPCQEFWHIVKDEVEGDRFHYTIDLITKEGEYSDLFDEKAPQYVLQLRALNLWGNALDIVLLLDDEYRVVASEDTRFGSKEELDSIVERCGRMAIIPVDEGEFASIADAAKIEYYSEDTEGGRDFHRTYYCADGELIAEE